jgi:hypothetical protein
MENYISDPSNPLFTVRDLTNLLQSIQKPHHPLFKASIEKILWFCINENILSSHLSDSNFEI